ncbi:MAG TPA: hypothetical protein VK894_14070 [Jiangellales bacterium]|nr:hypothetical protein [Jiangellales bacterium]
MSTLLLEGPGAGRDIATYARRVSRFDGGAVVRVVARGRVAGFFAETPFDALALRSAALAEPADVDEVVEAGTLAARAASAAGGGRLELPPPVPALRWTSGLPPTAGWRELGRLPAVEVADRVAEGVAEFRLRAEGGADAPSRAALESLAADVWAREMAAGVPMRLAHAAESYGFIGPGSAGGGSADGEVVLRAAGAWQRLDAPYGSVLGRSADVLGLFVG